ncbi:MAG: hypothetical protein CVV51_01690 [Spirochaetae bacterium HGW-Spirochaetae-7]|jgi:mRNA-degrading endonuclease toxin of MazEF toxin-antitoxin module|nr:MAG: hypothetical protein CVV51_01690 [Spirochaetae bacterium HGW-Spirochaetae-7]
MKAYFAVDGKKLCRGGGNVEITTKGKGYPTEVFIDQVGNLLLLSFVQADYLHTVLKNRLTRFTGTLDNKTMRKISLKIALALGLEGVVGEI